MKIAITGGYKGLGLYLSENLGLENVFVRKILRVQNRLPDYEAICDEIANYDVFINNASEGFCQTEMFYAVFQKWFGLSDKYIINIGSRAGTPNISKGYLYAAQKAALSHLTDNLVFNCPQKRCKITTLNLGWLDENPQRVLDEGVDDFKLPYYDVMKTIEFLLSQPECVEIPSMTLQHSVNYKLAQNHKGAILSRN